MNISSIVDTLKKYSPVLATAVSASNPLAGIVVSLISNAFGSDGTTEDLIKKINADPSAALKLRNLELQHEEALVKYSLDDRINARARELKMVEITGKRDWIIDFLAIVVVLSFFILCLINYFANPANDNIVLMLIGQISSGFMLCLSYYFGSSNK